MLNVTYKPLMLSAVMLSVVMLSVVAPVSVDLFNMFLEIVSSTEHF